MDLAWRACVARGREFFQRSAGRRDDESLLCFAAHLRQAITQLKQVKGTEGAFNFIEKEMLEMIEKGKARVC